MEESDYIRKQKPLKKEEEEKRGWEQEERTKKALSKQKLRDISIREEGGWLDCLDDK